MVKQIIKSTMFSDKILVIEFKNPKKNNALSIKILDELLELLSQRNIFKRSKVVVFKGFNDSSFSSGADLNEISKLKRENNLSVYHNKFNKVLKTIKTLNIIKISIIKSYCIGAGLILALNTDIRIANASCTLSIPATKLGVKLPDYQIGLLLQKFPKNHLLKEIILSGRKFSSTEAYNFNILNIVFNDKNFKNNYLKYLENFALTDEKLMMDYFRVLYKKE